MPEEFRNKLITCILPKGRARHVIKVLKEERQIVTANMNFARGAGRLTPMAYRGVGETTEKDILTVVVATEDADDLFDYIYHKAEIDRPHGGLMYIHPLHSATPYTLPELPDEK